MTLVRLGYSAISMHVKNSSTSKTMTFSRYSKIEDKNAALRKIVQIAATNLANLLRLLRHNDAHGIHFYRMSSKLIPLVNHPEIPRWNYVKHLEESLHNIRAFLESHPRMRVDFHADHFVLINSPKKDVFNQAVRTLRMHERLLSGMGIHPEHRCVMHVGGAYGNKEKALEQFLHNWGFLSADLQKMLILENDDKTFDLSDTLFLCEKLGVPFVFDIHHHFANHKEGERWEEHWPRILKTWEHSSLPIKMHISSPKSESNYRSHADFINSEMFMDFLKVIKGSVQQIDCMIEAKQKDKALFQLMKEVQNYSEAELVDGGSFLIK
ncbi:UV DNA damage repair endonuclease UvsE [Virgibacillus halodenitrificans]|uniref:UV DNA damage repair endonuclease UvsE n=1 Tax=Virgibacillus halodenitrificans TaxID=1482 RepID=UPI0024C055D8|nr:UV DNA damage repair endonuclease UvsE [Virgibacillus halodenitrificans]WHX27806.1 UV DNA damage repair endonuclease UvsE [Virgibacillus halodenitrificans]